MKKDICLGIILGMLGGAILISNVPAVKKAYEKGQNFVIKKVKTLCDKKAESDDGKDATEPTEIEREKSKKQSKKSK